VEQIIKVNGLKKYYKEAKAVDDISFQVERGELFGFLGVNGAGKSTTINMLCTLNVPTDGEVWICGQKLGEADDAIRNKIGVVWQNNCLDEKLTVKENLYVRGSMYCKGAVLKQSVDRVSEKLELKDIFNRSYGQLSGGQKRRCEIAAALIHTPELLFLDEPTTGLDPATRKQVWECLEQLRREESTTIFLTTHYMEEAARANHIAVIDRGKVKEFGTPFDLKERYAKDKLTLFPKEGMGEKMREKLLGVKESGATCEFTWKEEHFLVTLSDSLQAMPLLRAVEGCMKGFSLVQGTMDDVFLNIAGKDLDEQ